MVYNSLKIFPGSIILHFMNYFSFQLKTTFNLFHFFNDLWLKKVKNWKQYIKVKLESSFLLWQKIYLRF